MQNPYNEGLARGGIAGSTVGDCPYRSSFMATERSQWLAGFAAATNAEADFASVATTREISFLLVQTEAGASAGVGPTGDKSLRAPVRQR
jgi:ribosome modulation factor